MEKYEQARTDSAIGRSFQSLLKGLLPKRISSKLNAIGVIAIIGMVVLGSLSIVALTRLEAGFEQTSILYTQGQRTDHLLNLIFKTTTGLSRIVHEGDDSAIPEVLAQSEEMLSAFSAYKSSAGEFGLADDLAFAIENEPVFLQIRDAIFQAVSLYRSGEVAEAQQVKQRVDQHAQHILVFVERSSSLRQHAISDQFVELADLRAGLLRLQIIVFSLGSVLVLAIALGISRSISTRIETLTAGAEQVTAGDLTAQIQLRSDDEIGLLARAFNLMISRLRGMLRIERVQSRHVRDMVQRYVDYMSEVGRGNLSARLVLEEGTEEDPLVLLGHNLNETVDRLQHMTTQVRDVAGNLSSAAAEILTAITQQAAGANEQSAALSQATTSIEEVRTIATQTAQRAKGVADLAQKAASVSQSGQQAVVETVGGMETVKDRVETIAAEVLALSAQAQAIETIVASVNQIATQSNLLALNAAVQAARAGESGRGFVVVAQEMRSLARRSQTATEQVRDILGLVQHAVNTVVLATTEGVARASEGVNLAGEAGLAIQDMAQDVAASTQAATQIMTAAGQQESGMEQIAVAMESIHQVTVQNLAGVREVKQSAGELNSMAGLLRELVEQYRL